LNSIRVCCVYATPSYLVIIYFVDVHFHDQEIAFVLSLHIGKSKILRPFMANFVANSNICCIMNATNNYNINHPNSRDRTNYR
jgi:hypothetical protein